ncbi:hypothetical protein MLD38_006559 [Melastoma candidum]|uniref:Uncharacterized protein n=1 Tax=Melastoma candidum TaxID=119954 RepID=A0ACB9RNT4_9MYRT|nr:hypothetical protein MLD38_006559 [Melastoma candidum]
MVGSVNVVRGFSHAHVYQPSSRACNQCPPTSTTRGCPNRKAFLNPSAIASNNPFSCSVSVLAMAAPGNRTATGAKGEEEPRRVVVTNKHGEKLVGLLHETGSKEIVVLCHGFRSRKENAVMVTAANALETKGISAFRFDFAGNGESEGTFQYGNYYREADDLRAIIEHFKGANRVTKAILGHSKGGNVVLLYASKFQDIEVVVNVSGRYNLNRGIEERLGKDYMETVEKVGFLDVESRQGVYRVTKGSLMDRLSTDMHEACLKIDKSCRVLTVHGTADEIIPVEDAQRFAELIPSHELHIIEGANHSYTSHLAELASIITNFI